MTCRWRKLEADGRVQRCNDHFVGMEGQHVDLASDHPSTWVESDPCAWQADPCPDCDGGLQGIGALGSEGPAVPCSSCGGSGVDDSIPPELIGIGSIVRFPDDGSAGGGREGVIITTGESRFNVHNLPRSISFEAFDHGWSLVRAVPPRQEQS